MIVSSFAVLISIFNLVMCAQNEFDPIILEKELILRREQEAARKKRLELQRKSTKKQETQAEIGVFKRQI